MLVPVSTGPDSNRYPLVVCIQGKSRMRSHRTYGSVREAAGNGWPDRDRISYVSETDAALQGARFRGAIDFDRYAALSRHKRPSARRGQTDVCISRAERTIAANRPDGRRCVG
jgi:hypothetical protein